MKYLLRTVLLGFIAVCLALPSTIPVTENEFVKIPYPARVSQIIASNLLKDNIDVDTNHVFSPLGISSVLAILAEGARGETLKEFMTSLEYPEDKAVLRQSFMKYLESLQSKDFMKSPSFKTWFYIYKNNTAKDEYKEILRNYYFVEVKDIDRTDYDWSVPDTSLSMTTSGPSNSKDIIDFEDLKKSETFDEIPEETEEKEDPEEMKISMEIVTDMEKNASKFDRIVEDKQYVEVPVIKEELVKEQRKKQQKLEKDEISPLEDLHEFEIVKKDNIDNKDQSDEENETIKDDEKIIEVFKKEIKLAKPIKIVESNEPEKITIPLKKLDDLEIMQTVENHFLSRRFIGGRHLFQKDDVTSALSANSLIGNTQEKNPKSKMLLFNGLYYRGNWAYPFQQLRNTPEDIFYISKDQSVPVTMMNTRGKFRMAEIENLNSQAIEFPYENKRYSLLVFIPNQRDGLHELVNKLQPEDLQNIDSRLEESIMEVCLPKFNIETTSRSEKTLKRLGLNMIFSEKLADLGDITEEQKLHVDEVVQHVNLRVDEGASSENFLTAANTLRSSDENEKSIVINHPFIYFVRDNTDDQIIVAGKLIAPEFKDDIF